MDALNIQDTEFTGVTNTLPKLTLNLNDYSKCEISKRVTYKPAYEHDGTEYKLMTNKAKKQGVFTQMIKRSIEQLSICEKKWGKVFVLFFNLHHKDIYRSDNKWITRFRKNLNRKLERRYQMLDVGFVWSREQETAKGQHYHFCLFLDGRVVNHHKNIYKIIEKTWKRINENNHLHRIRNEPFIDVRDIEMRIEAVRRISYICKARGKGYRPPQTKDYNTSRLSK